jgi:hypothetical protein
MDCNPASWGMGETRHVWDEDVGQVVKLIHREFPTVRCNTYVAHPCPGWSKRSVDVWGMGGRGHPLPDALGPMVRQFAMNLRGSPWIRHSIWKHQLWTSWGGWSVWQPNDHDGALRHLHLTYWFP